MKRSQFWFVALLSLMTLPVFAQNAPQSGTRSLASTETQAAAPGSAGQDKQNLIHECSSDFVAQRHTDPEAATRSCSCLFENFDPDKAKIVQDRFMRTLADIEAYDYHDWFRQNSKIITECRNLGCAGKSSIYEHCDSEAALEAYNDEDYDTAIKYYSRSLDAYPDELASIVTRGQAYLAKGSYNLAIADFQNALKLNPLFEYTYRYLATAYHDAGRDTEALSVADNAVEKHVRDTEALELRGEIHEALGQRDAAITDYRTLMNMKFCNDDLRKARKNLIRLKVKDIPPFEACSDVVFNDGALDQHDPKYMDEEHVIVQVCKPNKLVSFEDAKIDLANIPREPESAHNVALTTPDQGDTAIVRKRVISSDPSEADLNNAIIAEVFKITHARTFEFDTSPLTGSTVTGQPVYEDGMRLRQGDIVALGVRTKLAFPDDGSYWFAIPRAIPHDGFTQWQEPVSQETRAIQTSKLSTEEELREGKELKLYPVNYASAPMMRFKIMSAGDYEASNRFWEREQIALNAENYRTFKATGKKEENPLFAPMRTDDIPSCNPVEENAQPRTPSLLRE